MGAFSSSAFATTAFSTNAFSFTDEYQATPGYFRKSVELYMRRVAEARVAAEDETQAVDVQRAAEAAYAERSLKLARAITRFDAEMTRLQAQIAAAQEREKLALASKERIDVERQILLNQQALLLTETQLAVFIEEMEVLDVAYFAVVAMAVTVH